MAGMNKEEERKRKEKERRQECNVRMDGMLHILINGVTMAENDQKKTNEDRSAVGNEKKSDDESHIWTKMK
jgi:hypothetical protein